MSIRTFKPYINRKDMDSVLTTLVSEKIGYGRTGKELSDEISGYLEIESGFMIKEYERGIEAVFRSIDFEEDDFVAVSPLSPFYYKRVLDCLGIKTAVIDVEPDTGIISLAGIQNFSGRIKAVVVDSPLGLIPDLEDLDEEITVIEDISNTVGGGSEEQKSGCWGNFIIMSMDCDRIVTAGCGVFVGAGGKKEKEKLRKTVSEMGDDKLLPDMNCALGLSQFSNINKNNQIRKEIAENFRNALMKSQHKTVVQKNNAENIYSAFPVIAKSGAKEIIKYALKKNIEVVSCFSDSILDKYMPEGFPEAENLKMRCLFFPLYPNLGKKNIEHIVKVLTTLP